MRFRTTIQQSDGTATGTRIPDEIVASDGFLLLKTEAP